MIGIIKEGLGYAQSHCFPLQSACFLIGTSILRNIHLFCKKKNFFFLDLVKTWLLCDEDKDAFTHLQGVKGVLQGVLHAGEKEKVHRLDEDEEVVTIPGEIDSRAASPLLFRNMVPPPNYLGIGATRFWT